MKEIYFLISFLMFQVSVYGQLPSCCSQPGACQSNSDPLMLNILHKNGLYISYFHSHSDGYLLLPDSYGDTVYTSREVAQHSIHTAFWFSLTPNLQLIGRLPIRYVINNQESIYGVGDASLGILYNIAQLLKLKEENNLIVQFNVSLPSGRSANIDTSEMYKTLLQLGTGNMNTDIGIRYLRTNRNHTFIAATSMRQSIYHVRNYKNASLYTLQIAYAHRKSLSKNSELAGQMGLQGERYLKDFVNNDIIYNSGYTMALLVPRITMQHKSFQYFIQSNIPLYRNYQGHQLKLNYTFTSGLNYVF